MRRLIGLTSVVAVLLAIASVNGTRAAAPSPARRMLDTTLPEVNFTGISLNDALEFVRDISGANVHVNWPALESTGVAKETLVNIKLRNVTLRKALGIMLSESSAGAPLTFYVADGVIEVTTREIADKDMVTRIYPVDDLILEVPDFTDAPNFNLDQSTSGGSGGGSGGGGGGGGGGGLFGGSGGGGGQGGQNDKGTSRAERAQALIDMIMDVIEPEIWKENGGNASIRFFNGSLIITAPRSVHEALAGPTD